MDLIQKGRTQEKERIKLKDRTIGDISREPANPLKRTGSRVSREGKKRRKKKSFEKKSDRARRVQQNKNPSSGGKGP